MTAAWYAVYTRHQHEQVVAQILAAKGLEVFLPLYSTAHRWRDRIKHLLLPLFPGYVFLRATLERRLAVLATPGVCHFVPSGDHPAAIPQVEIDAVRRLVEGSAGVESHPFLRCGDWVRVKSGPLEGIEGILTRKKSLCRLVLSVELLEKSVAVEVDILNVERVARPAPTLTKVYRGTSAQAIAYAPQLV